MRNNNRQYIVAMAAALAVTALSLPASAVLQHRINELHTQIDTVRAEVKATDERIDKLAERLETIKALETAPASVELDKVIEPESLGEFKLTAYCPCSKCCGEWADGITYTGTVATAGRTVAVDPRVIPLGSTVRINGHDYIAEDIGGAIKENRVDVFFDTHQEALQFGVQYADVAIIQ